MIKGNIARAENHPEKSLWSGNIPSGDYAAYMVTWDVNPQSVDAGVPEPLVDIFSSWLAAYGIVSFPAEKKLLRPVKWIETSEAAIVREMFHISFFSWEMGVQAGLLSSHNPPMNLEVYPSLKRLFGKDWYQIIKDDKLGIKAVFHAGIDGDAFCVCFKDEYIAEEMINNLQQRFEKINKISC